MKSKVKCPRCDTTQNPNPLGGGWYECPCCSQTWKITKPDG